MPYFFILPAFVMYVAAMAMGIAITAAHRPWRWLRPSLVSVLIWSSIGFVISNVVYVGVAVIAWRALEPLTAGGPSVIGGIAGAFLLFVAPFIAAAVGLAAGATFAIWRKLKGHLLSAPSGQPRALVQSRLSIEE